MRGEAAALRERDESSEEFNELLRTLAVLEERDAAASESARAALETLDHAVGSGRCCSPHHTTTQIGRGGQMGIGLLELIDGRHVNYSIDQSPLHGRLKNVLARVT